MLSSKLCWIMFAIVWQWSCEEEEEAVGGGSSVTQQLPWNTKRLLHHH